MKHFDDLVQAANILRVQIDATAEALSANEITKGFGDLLARNLAEFDATFTKAQAVSSRGAH